MDIRLESPHLTIERHAVVRVLAARGARVHCASGAVWVTRDGEPTDHVVAAGDAVCVEGRAAIVISALERSRVRVSELREPSRARTAGALRAFFGRLLRAAAAAPERAMPARATGVAEGC